MPKKTEDKKRKSRPWRDNLEAAVMAIVMAVMLKYFIVEAYQIPTPSMQPTLLGNDDTGLYDRIIVDKLSFHFRDPERFEVVTFKYPLDRSKSFIKRMVGMPDEHLRIHLGDLWTRPDAQSEWKPLRRPRPVQGETWKRIDPTDPRYRGWELASGARVDWTERGRAHVVALGPGRVRLPNDGGHVLDSYKDGYPGSMSERLMLRRRFAEHAVGDLRIEGRARAGADLVALGVELGEGERHYRFVLPGPRSADGRLTAELVAHGDDPEWTQRGGCEVVECAPPDGGGEPDAARTSLAWRLAPDTWTDFALQNLDDEVVLEIDGEVVWRIEVPPALDSRGSFALTCEGGRVEVDEIEVYRDIHYLGENVRRSEFVIPAGHYVMLGDNTQDSSDSREWYFVRYAWDGPGSEGRFVRGNGRFPENPAHAATAEGGRFFLRDEWGELHTFLEARSRAGEQEDAPYVPRHLITGRAVLVFWPYAPSLGVWRLKWIH